MQKFVFIAMMLFVVQKCIFIVVVLKVCLLISVSPNSAQF
jgi:hypothetical protein